MKRAWLLLFVTFIEKLHSIMVLVFIFSRRKTKWTTSRYSIPPPSRPPSFLETIITHAQVGGMPEWISLVVRMCERPWRMRRSPLGQRHDKRHWRRRKSEWNGDGNSEPIPLTQTFLLLACCGIKLKHRWKISGLRSKNAQIETSCRVKAKE